MQSQGEETVSTLIVDFSLVPEQKLQFHDGQLVQILGELCQEESDDLKYIQAHIVRDFSGVDAKLYQEAIALQSPSCPKVVVSPNLDESMDIFEEENDVV